MCYEEVAAGGLLPLEAPQQLQVSQAVVARHPVTRGLHDGIILSIKGPKYRVQFNRWVPGWWAGTNSDRFLWRSTAGLRRATGWKGGDAGGKRRVVGRLLLSLCAAVHLHCTP